MIQPLESIFTRLNNNCNYLVLRGWENLDNFHYDGDIDLLCDDKNKIIEILQARPVHRNERRCNYVVKGTPNDIRIDIRYLGDDYYCQPWQIEMLKNRQFNGQFYVLDKANYYYSLIYHILIQKRKFSNKYEGVLSSIYEGSNDFLMAPDNLLVILKSWMAQNKYSFTIPYDYGVDVNWNLLKELGVNSIKLKEFETRLYRKWGRIQDKWSKQL